MGNSGSGHHSYKSSPSQTQQFVQSLPRDGRGRGSSTTAAQKYYNGGFKVLPERVPGQKLRLTDNGNLLQNGGTLSGRRLIGSEPMANDQEFARLLKRRSDITHESSRTDDEYEVESHSRNRFERDGTLNKKYHSNPDLLHSHGIVSGNPSGVLKKDNSRGKKAAKKTKAPSPPRHQYSEDEGDNSHVHGVSGGHGATKDKRRSFANFLRSSPKKSNDGKNKVSHPPKQEFNDFGEHPDEMPIPYSMSPTDINAEVTAAKTDSRDKSVTYVLERREMHSSSSVLNINKTQNHLSSTYKNGPIHLEDSNPESWHFKRGQSPDTYKVSQPPIQGQSPSNRHPQLQANLSDGSMQARSIDRTDLRNRAFELQKRVRSMDSLAHSSDDRNIHLGRRNSPSPRPLREAPSRELLESLGANSHSRVAPLTRKSSYGSSLQIDITGERRSPLNSGHKQMGAAPSPMQLLQDNGPIPAVRSHLLQRSDSNNRKTFYYGGESSDDRQFVGSLDRRGLDTKKHFLQKDPVGTEGYSSEREHLRITKDNQRRQHFDHEDEDVIKIKQFNFDADRPLKDRQQRQVMPKQMVTQEMRDNDNSTSKMGKTYRDKNISSDNGLQGILFDDGRDRASDLIIKRRQKSGPGHGLVEDEEDDNGQLSSEDEMDINMQLRPTLPKRPPIMPRFSPTQVWRSFTLDGETGATPADRASNHSSEPEDADVFEERILRIARPIAPPRGSNEKSADSGISPGAVSPDPPLYDFDAVVVIPERGSKTSRPNARKPFQYLPTSPPRPISPLNAKDGGMHLLGTPNAGGSRPVYHSHHHHESPVVDKRRQWTPEEDLASDFDAGSADHVAPEPVWKASGPGMISTQPKLTSRKEMFSSSRQEISNKSESPDDSQESIKSPRKYKSPKVGDNTNSSQTYNSVRKLKRSLSGVLQGQVRTKTGDEESHTNLDDNWSLSRSLPNSLHNGHDGERMGPRHIKDSRSATSGSAGQPKLPRSESGPIFFANSHSENYERHSFADLEGLAYNAERNGLGGTGMRYNRNGHIVYLPKYEAMEIISENKERNDDGRKAYSDLGMGTKPTSQTNDGRNFPLKKPKKFTYQSTVRQLERKQLEEKLSQEVAIREHQRTREMDLVNKVEEEFQRKRDREKADIRNQLRILSMESLHDDNHTSYQQNNTRSLPREYPVYDDNCDDQGGHLRENSATDRNEWGHLSLPPMIIPPEDYDLTLPRESKSKTGGRLPKWNSSENRTKTQLTVLTNSGKNTNTGGTSPMGSSGFFGGIGKWMRRQQRLEKHNDHSPPRQEPEGAPSSFGLSGLHLDTDRNGPSTPNGPFESQPNSPHQQNRSFAVAGAKFSSGRLPDDQPYTKPVSPISPQQRKTIYTHLAEVVEKEEHIQKNRSPVGARDARTSIWITQDKPHINTKSAPNRVVANNSQGLDFYDNSYNLDREMERGKSDSSTVDNASTQYTRSTRDNYDR